MWGGKPMKRKNILLISALMLSLSLASCTVKPEASDSSEEEISVSSEEESSNSSESTGVSSEETTTSEEESSTEEESSEDISSTSEDSGTITEESSSEDTSSTGEESTPSEVETISVESVSLNFDTYEMEIDDQITLSATVYPIDATDKSVSWASSVPSVASVSDNGTINALSEGETVVTVTTTDGGFTASCAITVTAKSSSDDYDPEEEEGIYKIVTGGEYNISKDYKQIYVNAPEAEVVINLKGVTIENDENSPIYVLTADKVEISAKNGTTNYINDTRANMTIDEDSDTSKGKGAIYVADGDLKLKGNGTLNIDANYYNGIHGKDDVEIKNLTLDIAAVNHGVKGNDSITVTSGNISILCGGDGLHTENSHISSTGKQKGNVTINGGTLSINSWGDALSASYNAVIEETDASVPVSITAKTNKYSSYDGEVIELDDKLYLKSSTSNSTSYKYAAYVNGEWYPISYHGTYTQTNGGWGRPGPGGPGGGGGGSTSYLYSFEYPINATSFTIYRFYASSDYSTSSYVAKSDATSFNTTKNMVTMTISSSKISLSSWTTYTPSNRSLTSAKGIKANNEVYVNSGTITLTTYDDAIHANNTDVLENGSTPLGNVNIMGGTINISASDDGIHADSKLNISGGLTTISTSYEGIEGNVITVSGGSTYVTASDDGVNASSGNSTPSITVTGGYLDVTVNPSGDTDGIDSNGAFTQSGGIVIARGPNSSMAAALDTDGAITLKGGTIIVLGSIEGTLTLSGVSSYSLSLHSKGTKTVSIGGVSYSFNNAYSYSKTICYSSVTVTA